MSSPIRPTGHVAKIRGENFNGGLGCSFPEFTDYPDELASAAIGQDLRDRGLIFAGIDVIGDYLTEINVTSPTGLQEIRRFDGVALEENLWDAIEARLKA